VLKALHAAQTSPDRSPDRLTLFVNAALETVTAAIDLGKHRGEGSLATGSKLWRQRFVQAHRTFLGMFMSPHKRLTLWDSGTRRLRGHEHDEEAERYLSFDVATRCIPIAVKQALANAYPTHQPTEGESIVRDAFTKDDYARFDSITLHNIQYLGGRQAINTTQTTLFSYVHHDLQRTQSS
jgi:hypothetical protein